jgi:hypothetical protein
MSEISQVSVNFDENNLSSISKTLYTNNDREYYYKKITKQMNKLEITFEKIALLKSIKCILL